MGLGGKPKGFQAAPADFWTQNPRYCPKTKWGENTKYRGCGHLRFFGAMPKIPGTVQKSGGGMRAVWSRWICPQKWINLLVGSIETIATFGGPKKGNWGTKPKARQSLGVELSWKQKQKWLEGKPNGNQPIFMQPG